MKFRLEIRFLNEKADEYETVQTWRAVDIRRENLEVIAYNDRGDVLAKINVYEVTSISIWEDYIEIEGVLESEPRAGEFGMWILRSVV